MQKPTKKGLRIFLMKMNFSKIYLLIIIFVISISCLTANDLPRRAMLGARLMQVDKEIAERLNVVQGEGVYIDIVVEGSSAESIGLKVDDIVLEINDVKVNLPGDGVSEIQKLRAGDAVCLKIIRQGEEKHLSGELTAIPYEKSNYGEVIYTYFPYDEGLSRVIIHKPKIKKNKYPTIFFIQGYTWNSIDGIENTTTQKLLDSFVEKGFIIVKTEKAGIGDSNNKKHATEYSLFDEIDYFSASFNNMRNYDFIDLENVFIFGHSMGGVQAPLLKTSFSPRGIIVYGTVARPWFEYLIEVARFQRYFMGNDYLEVEEQFPVAMRFYYQLMVEKKSPFEMKQDNDIMNFMTNRWQYDGHEILNGRHYSFWQQLQDAEAIKAWAKTNSYVLSLWGESEYIALNPIEHQLIADIVNKYNPGKADFITVPKADHNFLYAESPQHSYQIRNDWDYYAKNFNKEIADISIRWIEERLK